MGDMGAALKARGATLATYRTQRGWSREQLAERAGLSTVTIYLVETGRRGGRLETWAGLALALDVPLLTLLGDGGLGGEFPSTGRRVLTPDQHAEIVARVRDGATTIQVGQDYSVSGERIRQIVSHLDPQATTIGAAARAARRREREAAAARARLDALGPCRVCLGPMQRVSVGERTTTCSAQCAELWPLVRYHLDEQQHETHRGTAARTILARPDRYGPTKVAWARRYLAERPPPNRRYRIPNTKTAQALAEMETLRRQRATDPKVAAS